MEWERAAWVGVLALASAGVAGGVAVAASKQSPPATGPSGGSPLPPPSPPSSGPTPQPVPVSAAPRLPPTVTTTTTTTTAPVLNYQNLTLQPGGNGAIWLHDVSMVNPTSLTIQLPAGATWALSNPLAKPSTLPKSVSNVVAHTSGSAPCVLLFNGTVGNEDDVVTLRWLDSSGIEQESQLTLLALAPPLQSSAPVGTIRTIPPVPQTAVTLQPGGAGLTGAAPWQTTLNVKSGTKVVVQLPSGGNWNGNGNPLQGGSLGLNLTTVYPGGSVTDVSGSQLSGNSPISFLFSGVVGKVSFVLTLNWTDATLRSQQAQISLVATA